MEVQVVPLLLAPSGLKKDLAGDFLMVLTERAEKNGLKSSMAHENLHRSFKVAQKRLTSPS